VGDHDGAGHYRGDGDFPLEVKASISALFSPLTEIFPDIEVETTRMNISANGAANENGQEVGQVQEHRAPSCFLLLLRQADA
jgi:hypothetical protein